MNSRRHFLKHSLAVSLGFTGLRAFCMNPDRDKGERELLNKSKNWLELPTGFQAKIISRWGDTMDDGFIVPGRADGMASFQIQDKVVLVRNHENTPEKNEYSAFGTNLEKLPSLSREYFYDFGYGKTPSIGGTTTLVFNEQKQVVEKQFLSLAGTNRNCAGGTTPWNSWITCEEDISLPGRIGENTHGFNFEVSATATSITPPLPLKAMGRFNHEAVCVDPDTGIVYQTEDRSDGLIYRFIPTTPGQLQNGGTLQALAVKGTKSFDTRNWNNKDIAVGESLAVEWISLTNVESPDDDLRLRGAALGAAVFARGEGMWFGSHELYFACTNGGPRKAGQVFKYVPALQQNNSSPEGGELTLFAESASTDILQNCDNLTVAPWGDVVLVEDHANAHIRGITREGKIYTIGRNIGSGSELAGICFSPSGKTMFVNIQEQGLTLAVTGPWHALRNRKA
jgi:uncharacterized protein